MGKATQTLHAVIKSYINVFITIPGRVQQLLSMKGFEIALTWILLFA